MCVYVSVCVCNRNGGRTRENTVSWEVVALVSNLLIECL